MKLVFLSVGNERELMCEHLILKKFREEYHCHVVNHIHPIPSHPTIVQDRSNRRISVQFQDILSICVVLAFKNQWSFH